MNYLASIGCYLCDRVGYYLHVFMQLQLQVEVPGSQSGSTFWKSWVLTSRRTLQLSPKGGICGWGVGLYLQCLCLRQNQQAALGHLLDLYRFDLGKLNYPIEKELKSCCLWECYFNVLVQWVGLVVYNSETLEHLWIVREVHYSLSAVRHSSFQCKLQSSHQDAEHYLWPVTGHE